jgi:arsenate reductase-like glutaredoxin family protein
MGSWNGKFIEIFWFIIIIKSGFHHLYVMFISTNSLFSSKKQNKTKPFAEICELTNILEGSIVRCITRLDETCREVRNAARIIGDSSLFQKMEEASKLIKRDIVFASSLYIS